MTAVSPRPPVSMRQIFKTWWPLAAGWLLMTIEIPALTAIIARAPDPEINLAAWGISFVVTLIIGSPAIMFLAVSTALSKDWASFITLRRYLIVVLSTLTFIHALMAFTPLYDLVVIGLIGAPAAIVEPARIGLMIMLPWSIGVGYRRFNYGVLIRAGQSQAITTGVVIRLGGDIIVLAIFFWLGTFSGLVIATTAFTLGILLEAVYSRVRVQPVLQLHLKQAAPVAEPLTLRPFIAFYIPLALTAVLQMLVQPIVSAGLSRMPSALESLATWPVVFGLLILFTSAGMSYTEVVVVMLDEPRSLEQLGRFTARLGIISTGLLFIMSATPLAALWFEQVAALPAGLVALAAWGLWLTLPMPGLRVLESWYQGILINAKQTQGITESVAVFLVVTSLILWAGVVWGATTGLYLGLSAMVCGDLARTAWLRYRTRSVLRTVEARDIAVARSLKSVLPN